MAHELHKDAQGTRMFYVKGSQRDEISAKPWHAEETNPIAYDVPPSIDQVIRDLRADVQIQLRPIYNSDGIVISSRQEIWRPNLDADGNQIMLERPNNPGSYQSGTTLEVVGPGYQVIQDWQVVEMFRPWVENGIATLETGGAIFEGRGFWILAKLKQENIEIAKDDVIQPFMLINNFHGGGACYPRLTDVRVVCNNTLVAACRGSKALFSIRHQGNIEFKIEEIQKILVAWHNLLQKNTDAYKQMASWKFKTHDQIMDYFNHVLHKPEKENEETDVNEEKQEEAKIERSRTFTALKAAFIEDSKKLPQNGHSLWRAFNAVTNFVTHSQGRTMERRIANMYAPKNLSTQGFDVALKVLQGKIELKQKLKVQVLKSLS
jgi:phage/plasmid-like protein (TIGR03299 family)